MIGDLFAGRSGTMVAAYQMAGDGGAVTGPLAAGLLVDTASYAAGFGLAAGVLALAAILGVFAPETQSRHPVTAAAEQASPG
jgi:MFS family permease